MSTTHSQPRRVPVPESMLESGIWVFESRHDEMFSMKQTQHRFPKLLFIRDGAGEIEAEWPEIGHRRLPCSSGDCFLIPTKTKHRITDDARRPLSLFGLAIDPKKISPCAEIEAFIPAGRVPRRRVSLLNVERRFRRLLYLTTRHTPASTLSAVSGAIEVFALLSVASESSAGLDVAVSSPGDSHLQVLDEYLQWLSSNFFEQLTVESGARACGMSRRTFTSAFRRRTGNTWLAHLNRLRIDHAIELLEETESKVTSIAFQSGFEELSTFYRVFKRLTGRQPLDYRQVDLGQGRAG